MSVNGDFFYYSLCHFCKNPLRKYQRCASCKSVSYCSEAHQKLDWKAHRKLCNAIKLTRQKECSIQKFAFEDWKIFRIHCQATWRRYLKRDLFPSECQMWMFPRVCSVCYTEGNLQDCKKCLNAAYCCDEHVQIHKKTHDKFCYQLQLCMAIDLHLGSGNCYPTINVMYLLKYLYQTTNMQELIKSLQVFETNKSEYPAIEEALKADTISPGATIYQAMTYLELDNDDSFIIHVVGSSSAEATIDWHLVSEIIFHYKPNLQKIIFILIGPEAWLLSSNTPKPCKSCSGSGKTVDLKVFRQLYHEVTDIIEAPNLVVAFNCGLHEYKGQKCDQWESSIPVLIKHQEVPFAFTSYTQEELANDMERLTSLEHTHLKVLYYGENYFASLRPIRDWCTEETPIFYSHKYLGVLKQSI